MCSPRARGCTVFAFSDFASVTVFPARAGMYRGRDRAANVRRWNSPRARGCTARDYPAQIGKLLWFPARAGMYRCATGSPRGRSLVCSPRARGCTVRDCGERTRCNVSPRARGMYRPSSSGYLEARRRCSRARGECTACGRIVSRAADGGVPRARGGCTALAYDADVRDLVFPARARGCTERAHIDADVFWSVLPRARGGVPVVSPISSDAGGCSPRGDVPFSETQRRARARCSPRAWGCTVSQALAFRHRAVFPRAGMYRPDSSD